MFCTLWQKLSALLAGTIAAHVPTSVPTDMFRMNVVAAEWQSAYINIG
jgi:hypothetical protein